LIPTAGITDNTCGFYGIYFGIFSVRRAGKYAQEMCEFGGLIVSRYSKTAKSVCWLRHEGESHGKDFHDIWYSNIFAKYVEAIQVPLNSDKPNG
jgi:hypothetical protein